MTANPCHGPAADTSAARDLEWLLLVRAIRRFEADGDAGFVVELRDRKLLALPAEAVAAFRRGVLCGWALPRSETSG